MKIIRIFFIIVCLIHVVISQMQTMPPNGIVTTDSSDDDIATTDSSDDDIATTDSSDDSSSDYSTNGYSSSFDHSSNDDSSDDMSTEDYDTSTDEPWSAQPLQCEHECDAFGVRVKDYTRENDEICITYQVERFFDSFDGPVCEKPIK
eukprot:85754_1